MSGVRCENCGSPKCSDLGCTWCDEQAYIDYQEMLNELTDADQMHDAMNTEGGHD